MKKLGKKKNHEEHFSILTFHLTRSPFELHSSCERHFTTILSCCISTWLTISLPFSELSKIRSRPQYLTSNAPVLTCLQVNCSFYYKIGACRHGDRCSRKHVKPSYSQTILLPNMYQNPAFDPKNKMNPSQLQNHFDAFYEDFWCEMCKYGELEEVVVCDNNNDRTLLPCSYWPGFS